MRNLFCTLIIISLLATTVHAAETATKNPNAAKFRSYVKRVSCGDVVKGIEKPANYNAFTLMVSSFVTGTNYARKRVSQMDLKSLTQVTEQYCRQNPDKPVLAALMALDRTMQRRIELERKQKK